MNLRDLQYITTLFETQHFGKAAERCFVSQPTLSMQIKKLEAELGIKLIERDNKNIHFTPAGNEIIKKAEEMLSIKSEIYQIANTYSNPEATTLHLSLIPTIAPYLLPKILPAIKKSLPKLNLILHEEKTADTLKMIQQGKLDVAILALPIDTHGLIVKKLFREHFLLALPNDHPLKDKATIKLRDIDHENLLLLKEGHCMREQTLEVCTLHNRDATFEATSLETLKLMVRNGMGVTLLPEMAAQADKRYVCVKHFSKPEPFRDVIMVWRKTSHLQDLFLKLTKLISEKY